MPVTCAPSTAEMMPFARARAQISRTGKHDAGRGGDVAEKEDASARRNRVIEKIESRGGIRNRHGQRDALDDDAVTLRAQQPRLLAAGMLLIGHEDFIAGLEIEAIRDVVVGLGGVADQRDFIARATDKGGQRIAEFIPRRVAPDGIVLGIALREFFGFVVAIEDGAENRRGRRSYGAVVEIDLVFGNQELFAQLGPVGFFVRIVKRGIGQARGGLLEKIQPAMRSALEARRRRPRWKSRNHGDRACLLRKESCAHSTRVGRNLVRGRAGNRERWARSAERGSSGRRPSSRIPTCRA